MRLGLALLVVFLVAASPAAADSILFVRDGNVWISTPDGSTQRPLTAGGGFSAPSMSDGGTIVALRGRSLVRCGRTAPRSACRSTRSAATGSWRAGRMTRGCPRMG